eukprot:gnl/TRDRNA2_/TRDRNA2_177424_c5_seq4.p1 gnl/TRDRNA2_/TRDRNA2_177424_c5~~gnl/TRDRNA2_/TRDRNA2_177424_c5_seq4.p1  ORF type:complete len:452 (+),score=78.92 gnl/TRDRNA2_/TRDRNA2_177424_c5_seq4:24-1379(+)
MSDPWISRIATVLKLDYYDMDIEEMQERLKAKGGEEATPQVDFDEPSSDEEQDPGDQKDSGLVEIENLEGERRFKYNSAAQAETEKRVEKRKVLISMSPAQYAAAEGARLEDGPDSDDENSEQSVQSEQLSVQSGTTESSFHVSSKMNPSDDDDDDDGGEEKTEIAKKDEAAGEQNKADVGPDKPPTESMPAEPPSSLSAMIDWLPEPMSENASAWQSAVTLVRLLVVERAAVGLVEGAEQIMDDFWLLLFFVVPSLLQGAARQALHSGDAGTWLSPLRSLWKALQRLGSERAVLFRGGLFHGGDADNGSKLGAPADLLREYAAGRKVHWTSFAPCSASLRSASEWGTASGNVGQRVLFKIRAQSARRVPSFRGTATDDFIMMPNTRFVVSCIMPLEEPLLRHGLEPCAAMRRISGTRLGPIDCDWLQASPPPAELLHMADRILVVLEELA